MRKVGLHFYTHLNVGASLMGMWLFLYLVRSLAWDGWNIHGVLEPAVLNKQKVLFACYADVSGGEKTAILLKR
jgi:hypothetical protein